LKINSFYSFKESIYLLTKTFIQIFSAIFLKFSGKGAAPQPLQTSCPCSWSLYTATKKMEVP